MNSIDPQKNNISTLLRTRIRNGSIAHAYLIAGGTKEARTELGKWFAQALLCTSEEMPCGECLSCRKFMHGNHEDLISIIKEKDRETLSVEQIGSLIDQISLKPYGKRHVVLIYDAELMNTAAQNKLLKTLEEPSSASVMILMSDREDSMLPTVLSRCIKLHVNSDVSDVPDDIKKAADSFAECFINGSPYYRKKNIIMPVISDRDTGRDMALLFLDALEDRLCTELKSNAKLQNAVQAEKISEMIRQTEISRKYLRQLHSVQWTLKQLCLR